MAEKSLRETYVRAAGAVAFVAIIDAKGMKGVGSAGQSDLTADEAVAASKPTKSRGPSPRDFLLDLLTGGPVLQKAVIERGAERGFSSDQLRRAKRAIGIVAFKQRGEEWNSPWLWALPQHVPEEAESEPE
jgi:hypothetical protein